MKVKEEEEEEEEEYEVPPELEDVLEMLLSALRDKDTVVRWSGAKGWVTSVPYVRGVCVRGVLCAV